MFLKSHLVVKKNEAGVCTDSQMELPYHVLFLYRYCVEKSWFLIHPTRHDNERTILN